MKRVLIIGAYGNFGSYISRVLASSVPCLTSALVDHYKNNFKMLEKLDYGITTAQKTNRGLATTMAMFSYTGRRFKTLNNGEMKDVYGWQNLHARKYPELGWCLLGNCDVPDLALFPDRYPELKSVRFLPGWRFHSFIQDYGLSHGLFA